MSVNSCSTVRSQKDKRARKKGHGGEKKLRIKRRAGIKKSMFWALNRRVSNWRRKKGDGDWHWIQETEDGTNKLQTRKHEVIYWDFRNNQRKEKKKEKGGKGRKYLRIPSIRIGRWWRAKQRNRKKRVVEKGKGNYERIILEKCQREKTEETEEGHKERLSGGREGSNRSCR